MAPGEGEQPLRTRSPSPNPLDAATFASSSTQKASPPRGAGGVPGEKVAQEEPRHGRGLRDPHTLSTNFVLSHSSGNSVPKPYTPCLLPCPEVPYIPRMLLINYQPFPAADRSPPPSERPCRGDRDGPHSWPCPLCPLRSPSLAQVGPSAPFSFSVPAASPGLPHGQMFRGFPNAVDTRTSL